MGRVRTAAPPVPVAHAPFPLLASSTPVAAPGSAGKVGAVFPAPATGFAIDFSRRDGVCGRQSAADQSPRPADSSRG